VEEKNGEEVKEAQLSFIDALLVKHIRVYDSDVCSESAETPPDVEEIRNEMPEDD
jgi:hypothetical protein